MDLRTSDEAEGFRAELRAWLAETLPIGKTAVQVFGGVGFTWAMDDHLYLKRAAVLATHFSSDQAAEAVAESL
jgi:alkylation response protein AidB-like acyl-CoA dehydrogenase